MKEIKKGVSNNRIGEEKNNYQGCLMRIIQYDNSNNIIVEFQDKCKYKKKSSYNNFIKGEIKNPYCRVGETNITKEGYLIEIIDCDVSNANNITIEFKDDYKFHKKTKYSHFLSGEIKNPFHKSVLGIGYIGDTEVDSASLNCWRAILHRCYSDKSLEKHPTYKDCIVCDEWLCYANFKCWYDKNYYQIGNERMHIDKDILVKGNKIYSPETCIFVPQSINSLFIKANKIRNGTIGVSKRKYGYSAPTEIINGYNKKFGNFNTETEAFISYKKAKENYIKKVADKYRDKIPLKLYDAMYNYQVEITD